MADDPMAVIGNIGQKMLSVPTDILSVGTRRVTEDMSMMSAKIQDLGTTLIPAGGMSLPQLPGLPGLGASGMGAGQEQAAAQAAAMQAAARSTPRKGAVKKTSYMRV